MKFFEKSRLVLVLAMFVAMPLVAIAEPSEEEVQNNFQDAVQSAVSSGDSEYRKIAVGIMKDISKKHPDTAIKAGWSLELILGLEKEIFGYALSPGIQYNVRYKESGEEVGVNGLVQRYLRGALRDISLKSEYIGFGSYQPQRTPSVQDVVDAREDVARASEIVELMVFCETGEKLPSYEFGDLRDTKYRLNAIRLGNGGWEYFIQQSTIDIVRALTWFEVTNGHLDICVRETGVNLDELDEKVD